MAQEKGGVTVSKPLKTVLALIATAVSGAAAFADGAPASPTAGWNHLWHDVLIDLFVVGGVFGLATIYLLIRYRAKSANQVGDGPVLSRAQVWAWALIPAALFMADDFLLSAKGWSLWNIQREVPAGAMEVKVNAAQWFFEYDYGNGVTSDELVVPVGKPVVLRMTSVDVVHSFGLTEYRLKEDVMPGRVTYLWFYPDKPLQTTVVCVEYCGMAHSGMNSPVKAVPPAEFDAWLTAKKKTSSVPGQKVAANVQ